MYSIIDNKQLNENTFQLEILAPRIANHYQAGQFVIIRSDSFSERIPLTIASINEQIGSITIIFQAIGVATLKLAQFKKGDNIEDLLGPLGKASHLPKQKEVIMISGGVGTAIAIPTLTALVKMNNTITSILGFRNQEAIILENEVRESSNECYLTTDDGSCGEKGLVTDVLKRLVTMKNYDFIYCIGPIPMMKAVTEIAKEYKIAIQVSLNPIMIDGTGMCGGCRVTVAGETKFACIDGPEFDGLLVDFDELAFRNRAYNDHHKCNLERYYGK